MSLLILHFFVSAADTIHGDSMSKRAATAFFMFCIIIGVLCLRLYSLSARVDAANHIQSHYKRITVDYLRLPVYDCRGERLCNCETESYIAAKPVPESLSVLRGILSEDEFKSAAESLAKGSPVCVRTDKEMKDNSINTVTLKKYKRYSGSSLVHLLGYVNSEGTGISGLEKAFDSFLKTEIPLCAGFACDANGHILAGSEIKTDPLYNTCRGGLWLTVDKKIQEITETALKNSDIKKGAALICSTKTGKIKAMVSVPTFDPENIQKSLNDADAPLINRALSAYPVGSVFKAAVAAAALDNGITADYSYKCTGSIRVDDRIFSCSGHTAHGQVDMQKALTCSCNCYFVKLAQKIGYRPILEIAGILGYGRPFEVAESIFTSAGNIPSAEVLHSSGQLALFSFGQGTLTATAIQIANTFSAVGNNGVYIEPYVVNYITDTAEEKVYEFKSRPQIRVISEESAEKLKNMLKTVVRNGTAKKAQTEFFESAGKTATAQTGVFNSDKTEKLCTWFGGFFPADDPEYTVVILKEDGTTGGEDCAPVFKEIAEKIYNLTENGRE